jgi:hypothetical protein
MKTILQTEAFFHQLRESNYWWTERRKPDVIDVLFRQGSIATFRGMSIPVVFSGSVTRRPVKINPSIRHPTSMQRTLVVKSPQPNDALASRPAGNTGFRVSRFTGVGSAVEKVWEGASTDAPPLQLPGEKIA